MQISSTQHHTELLRKYTEGRALYLKKLQDTERLEDMENKRIMEKIEHNQKISKDKGNHVDIYV